MDCLRKLHLLLRQILVHVFRELAPNTPEAMVFETDAVPTAPSTVTPEIATKNISGGPNMSLFEVTEAAEEIRAAADPEANIIFGTSFNERLGEEVAITVIATGFDGKRLGSSARASTSAVSDATAKAPRDFLEELERQRSSMNETGVPDAPAARTDDTAAYSVRSAAAVEPVAPRRAAYDADDLEIPSFLRRSR